MDLKQLFDDDRAVSPVIGVILMVAITVILAAVIGTFVLGLGDQVQNTTPRASFAFDQTNETVDPANGSQVETLTVAHETGDTLSESNIDVTVEGNPAFDVNSNNKTRALWNESADISAGSSVRVVGYYTGGGSTISGADLGAFASDPHWLSGGGMSGSDYNSIAPGDTVRIVYSSPDSDSSSTLGKKEIQ